MNAIYFIRINRKSLLILSIFYFLLCPAQVNSQSVKQIFGQVVDLSGKPYSGASVVIKGQSRAYVTGSDGSFKLDGVRSGEIFIVSALGEKSLSVKVDNGVYYLIQIGKASTSYEKRPSSAPQVNTSSGNKPSSSNVNNVANSDKAIEYYQLGCDYIYGANGKSKNESEGIKYLKKSIQLGNLDAKFRYANYLEYGKTDGAKVDYNEVFTLYKSLADESYQGAYFNMGLCYEYGKGTDVNYEEALKWYEKYGSDTALESAKKIREKLKTLDSSYEGASSVQLYEKGVAYLYGNDGLPENKAEGVKWIKKAAELGNNKAKYDLAGFYKQGRMGVTEDRPKAYDLYKYLAGVGYKEAYRDLAFCYRFGYGTARNMDEAIKWYQKSASKYDLIQVDEIKEQIEKERAKEREKNSVISSSTISSSAANSKATSTSVATSTSTSVANSASTATSTAISSETQSAGKSYYSFVGYYKDNQGRVISVSITVDQYTMVITSGEAVVRFTYKQNSDNPSGKFYSNDQYGLSLITMDYNILAVMNTRFDRIDPVTGQFYNFQLQNAVQNNYNNNYNNYNNNYNNNAQNGNNQRVKQVCTYCNGTGKVCHLKTVPTYGSTSKVLHRCSNCNQLLSVGSVHIQVRCPHCNGTGYR